MARSDSNTSTPPNPHKGRTGVDRMRRAAGFSVQGLAAAYRAGSAAVMLALVLAAGVWSAALWSRFT